MKRASWALLLLASVVLVGLTSRPSGCTSRPPLPVPSTPSLASPLGAAFDFAVGSHLLIVKGTPPREASLLLWVDDAPRPLPVYDLRVEQPAEGGLVLHAPVQLGSASGDSARVRITLRSVDPATLHATLQVESRSQSAHAVRLRVEMEAPASVFGAGLGEMFELGRRDTAFVTLQEGTMLGMVGVGAPLTVERFVYPAHFTREAIGLAVESAPVALEQADAQAALDLVVGTPSAVYEAMFRARGELALKVHGKVQGAPADAAVYAVDDAGTMQARALVDAEGNFELAVPKPVSHFFAESRGLRGNTDNLAASTSAVASFEPGVPWPLLLSLEPSGTCKVQVFDGESQRPLTARLMVRGVGATRDPWFGPDYRASGAGPVADLRDGTAEFELPAGTYKVQATHGPMYSIDEVQLQVLPNTPAEAILRPRRVVPGLGLLSADLHVHARPSYDSPVQTEDRVLSLVAAGVEFAVPTEHNVVGDYESALSFTGQQDRLRFVPGVEVTTFAPKLGHFGVFPYGPDKKVPPYRGTSLPALFAFVRKDPSRVLIVHHPFLGSGMGYFDRDPRFSPAKGYFGNVPLGFDAIELLNGYETLDAKRTEQTLDAWLGLLSAGHHAVGVGSSDSHRILYGWAGYPRTLVRVQDAGVVDLATLDSKQVLAALKAGRAQATTGPVLELTVQGAAPGETVAVGANRTLAVHVVVRAAPWIDVSRVDVYVGNHVAASVPVERVALRVGKELGGDAEIFARSVRLSRDLELPAPAGPSYVVVVARGDEKLEWVLPATALPPLALSNPIWIK